MTLPPATFLVAVGGIVGGCWLLVAARWLLRFEGVGYTAAFQGMSSMALWEGEPFATAARVRFLSGVSPHMPLQRILKTYSSSYLMMKLNIGLEFGGVWIYAYKKLFSKLKGAKKVEDLMKDFLQNTKFCSIVKIPGNWTSVHKHHRRILRGCSLELSPFLSRDFSSACPTTAASWKLQSIDDRGKSRRFLGPGGAGRQIQS